MSKSQHLIELTASNFKRLTAARIAVNPESPEGTIVLTGENGAGKSSVIDAIVAALGGERAAPEKPVKTGTDKAKIVLKTEELIVTRTFTADGGGTLTVKDASGRNFSSPQNLLNNLASKIGFDPLEFSRMDAKKQSETLLKICPVDIDLVANAADQKKAYDERRDWGKSVKETEAQLALVPDTAGAPDEEVSIFSLTQKLAEIHNKAVQRDTKVQAIKSKRDAAEKAKKDREEYLRKAGECGRDMALLTQQADEMEASLEKGESLFDDAKAIEQQIANAEKNNALARTAKQRKEIEARLAAAKQQRDAADSRLTELQQERSGALLVASFPVDGLSLDENGNVTLYGEPFSQASTSQQIKVGVALAAAANPALKLAFVRDGSLLDKASMKELAEMTAAHDMQVIIERVEDSSPSAIEIVDGVTVGTIGKE
jgi:ABC-type cobalamin/Fe3+-siderophores transport system ATPase subunit